MCDKTQDEIILKTDENNGILEPILESEPTFAFIIIDDYQLAFDF